MVPQKQSRNTSKAWDNSHALSRVIRFYPNPTPPAFRVDVDPIVFGFRSVLLGMGRVGINQIFWKKVQNIAPEEKLYIWIWMNLYMFTFSMQNIDCNYSFIALLNNR